MGVCHSVLQALAKGFLSNLGWGQQDGSAGECECTCDLNLIPGTHMVGREPAPSGHSLTSAHRHGVQAYMINETKMAMTWLALEPISF